MLDDIIFTGRAVKLRTGHRSPADISKFMTVNALVNGIYTLHVHAARERSATRWDFLNRIHTYIANLTDPLHPDLDKHLISIAPIRVKKLVRKWPLYMHDYIYNRRVAGIQIPTHFFDTIDDYAKHMRKDSLRLRVDYANKAPWMATARGEVGTTEVQGDATDPRVMEYHEASGWWGTNDNDEDPWCGSFVAWVLKQHDLGKPAHAYRAKAWKDYGQTVEKPTYGSLAIKSRTGGGHVGFVVGQNPKGDKLYLVGGNQSNAVNISEYNKNVFTDYVLPTGYDASEDWLPEFKDKASAAGSEL